MVKKNSSGSVRIDLLQMIRTLWDNVFTILFVAVIVAAAAFAYTWFFVTPTYEAVASMYVNNSSFSVGSTSFSISSSEISASNSLVNSYIVLLESRETLEEVIADTGIPYSYEELIKKVIKTEAFPGTPAFKVTVSSSDPQEAEMIANSIAKILPQRIAEIIDGASMRIIDHAIIPARRASPSYVKVIVLYGLAGAFIAALWCIFSEVFHTVQNETVGSSGDLLGKYPKLKTLAKIPDMDISAKKGYYYSSYYGSEKKEGKPSKTGSKRKHLCENMSFAAHEAFKRLRTNIVLSLPKNDGCKVLGITSAQPGEGKSVCAVNLAYSFSELGKKVLLIDGDLHRPTIGEKLGLKAEIGLDNLLSDTDEVASAVVRYTSKSGKTSFDVICTKAVENSSELLSSPRFSALLEALQKAYDLIIIDLPPVYAVVDAVIAEECTDGIIIVVRENETSQMQFDSCIEQLDFAESKILGLVFNASIEGVDKKYQYKYGYYN